MTGCFRSYSASVNGKTGLDPPPSLVLTCSSIHRINTAIRMKGAKNLLSMHSQGTNLFIVMPLAMSKRYDLIHCTNMQVNLMFNRNSAACLAAPSLFNVSLHTSMPSKAQKIYMVCMMSTSQERYHYLVRL